jgi:hypothetical protein
MSDETTCTALLNASLSFWVVSVAAVVFGFSSATAFMYTAQKKPNGDDNGNFLARTVKAMFWNSHSTAQTVTWWAGLITWVICLILFVPSQTHSGTKDTACSYSGMWDQFNNGTRYDTPSLATSQLAASLVILIPLQAVLLTEVKLMHTFYGSI